MEVEVEVKGTSEYTARHLELRLLRELEASTSCVHPKKRGGYYHVHDERVLIGCKKRDAHHGFLFVYPEVIPGEKGKHPELVDPWRFAVQRVTKFKPNFFSRMDRTFPIQTGQNFAYPEGD